MLEIRKGKNNSQIINDNINEFEFIEKYLKVVSSYNRGRVFFILSNTENLDNKIVESINSFSVNAVYILGKETEYNLKLINSKYYENIQLLFEELKTQNIENAVLFFKGADDFREISKYFELYTHETICEINLTSIKKNIDYFKSLLKPDIKIIGMVKANAYGLGSYDVSLLLQDSVDYLAVAYVDEGVFLRKKGIITPIMVMSPEIEAFDSLRENNLEPTIFNSNVLNKFIENLKENKISNYPVHIKINTGMNRLGFQMEEVEQLSERIKEFKSLLDVKSIFSHLAVPEESSEDDFTREQAEKLKKAYNILVSDLGYKPMLHIDKTVGITNYPEYQFDASRIGIGLYGYLDNKELLKKMHLVAILKAKISNIVKIKEGETVGYGRKFKAKRDSVIGIIPIGYADGIHRKVGNGVGYVTINNKKAPIIGSVCMDMFMVDITEIDCLEGDKVIILGESPNVNEYAEWSETIQYEIFTSISERIKKVYIYT